MALGNPKQCFRNLMQQNLFSGIYFDLIERKKKTSYTGRFRFSIFVFVLRKKILLKFQENKNIKFFLYVIKCANFNTFHMYY